MTENSQGEKHLGLTSEQVHQLQIQFGRNELVPEKKSTFFHKVIDVIKEPMFLLLIVAAVIYFILGEPRDGLIMLVFVIGIISIEVIQEWKTDKTLKALRELSAPQIKVLRDGQEQTISSVDIVPGDLMIITEGIKIPADGEVIRSSDLCVDESSLTGEAMGVWKVTIGNTSLDTNDYWRRDYCYAGTMVTQGSAIVRVDKIGSMTEYGKIGQNVAQASDSPTPLQKQTGKLVQVSAGLAAVLFALVSGITFLNLADHPIKARLIESILSGITLAMAMIPEEFPVILTVFLSMGAWRLAKRQSLVRRLPSVETLGAVSVLCVDKTGTITMNQMTVRETWSCNENDLELHEVMGLACETETYDPMEKAMLQSCANLGFTKESLFNGRLVIEYPFTNETKMMGHVWERNNRIWITAKGSPEQILTLCKLSGEQKSHVERKMLEFSQQGLRVIAVAQQNVLDESEVPARMEECQLELCGLVGLADPPRATVKEDIRNCKTAGIRVIMITGDNGITASAIARQIGMQHSDEIITGDELNQMSAETLREKVKTVSIFSRVIPEHKMRIVQALKANGEIVAMTGDGVNDAPALKYADIGIAMGKRGSEVSREAADLILLDDNFTTIVHTIEDGRRIYDNIRKAVGYVFTIHIPIALASLLAPLLQIAPASLMLLPLHVVLLELVIDPTCSIVLERQPAEKDIMERAPRNPNEKLLNAKILVKSILQGLAIFVASFGTYLVFLKNYPENTNLARTMGLVIILLSNVLLVQVNSSRTEYAFQTFHRLARDKVLWAVTLGTIFSLPLMIYTPINSFLKLSPLSVSHLLLAAGIAVVAVMWYELVKLVRKFMKISR
jgi:Ca2+-transporting ATPase